MSSNPSIAATEEHASHVYLNRLPTHPKVSILITNYNYEEFLPRSIESVLTQSWRPIEIIVSDDGSQDRSCDVVNSYVDRGEPVILVRNNHSGMAGCLNSAFAASTGQIICMLDADDHYMAGKIDAVVSAFRANPDSGFCIHRTQRIDQRGRLGGAFPLLQKLPAGDCTESTIRNSGVLMGLPPTSALSLRREIAERIFPIPTYYTGYAEQMIHRLAPLITSICSIDKSLSSWTQHRRNDQNSSQVKVDRLEREIRFMELLWRDQHRFLLQFNPMLALELQQLRQNALYVKMRYIRGRLKAENEFDADHDALCAMPEIQNSYTGMFWKYSKRLPRPIFKKSIELLETQSGLKQFLGSLLHRGSPAA
jgi:glycosyltransferase involved in cell wall biosynthesis